MHRRDPKLDSNDTNYVFLRFVIDYLPQGVVGLLIVMVFFASMNSTSSELNALASTTVVDIYRRLVRPDASDRHYVFVAKLATVLWGAFAIGFAQYASRLGTAGRGGQHPGLDLLRHHPRHLPARVLRQAASPAPRPSWRRWWPRRRWSPASSRTEISFLWYNVVGCVVVVGGGAASSSCFRVRCGAARHAV